MKAAIAAIKAEWKCRIAQAETALKTRCTHAPRHFVRGRAPPRRLVLRDGRRSRRIPAKLANPFHAERRAANIRLTALDGSANTLASGIDRYQTG